MHSSIIVKKKFQDCSRSIFMRDWCTVISINPPKVCRVIKVWQPPNKGDLKLNFYGLSKGNQRPAGFGCVLRDSNGTIVWVIYGPLEVCDSTKAEAIGLLMGLRELKRLGIGGCFVEGDSMVAIGWEKGKGNASWQLAQITHEIRELAILLCISLVHVLWEQTKVADKLANWGIGFSSIFICCDIPKSLPLTFVVVLILCNLSLFSF